MTPGASVGAATTTSAKSSPTALPTLLHSASSPNPARAVLSPLPSPLPLTPKDAHKSNEDDDNNSGDDEFFTPRTRARRHVERSGRLSSRDRRGIGYTTMNQSGDRLASPRRALSPRGFSPRVRAAAGLASPRHRPRGRSSSFNAQSNASEAEDGEYARQQQHLQQQQQQHHHHHHHHHREVEAPGSARRHSPAPVEAAAVVRNSSPPLPPPAGLSESARRKMLVVSRAMSAGEASESGTEPNDDAGAAAAVAEPTLSKGSSRHKIKKKKLRLSTASALSGGSVARALETCLQPVLAALVWTALPLDQEISFNLTAEYRARVRGLSGNNDVVLTAQAVDVDTLFLAFRNKTGVIDGSHPHLLRITSGAASAMSSSLVEPRHAVVALETRAASMTSEALSKHIQQAAVSVEAAISQAQQQHSTPPTPKT
jgi:hypothetical protein